MPQRERLRAARREEAVVGTHFGAVAAVFTLSFKGVDSVISVPASTQRSERVMMQRWPGSSRARARSQNTDCS